MNATLKTILLTLLTLSVLTIALIEVSGVSTNRISDIFSSKNEKVVDKKEVEDKKLRQEKMNGMEKTMIQAADSLFDFGKIKAGEKVKHDYWIKNVGDKPLFIANVQASCGCTIPQFPTEPIMPGQTGVVILEFNSAGKHGHVQKNALIMANAINAPYPISFTAEVE